MLRYWITQCIYCHGTKLFTMTFDISVTNGTHTTTASVTTRDLDTPDAVTRPVRGHYNDVIMNAIASQITSLTIVYSTLYSYADQRKHQNSASLAFVWGIHRGPVNSPHKWPVTRKMFPFDDVIMGWDLFSDVEATFSHVGGPLNRSLCHHRRCLNNPIYRILGHVLHVEQVSCVTAKCGQHK